MSLMSTDMLSYIFDGTPPELSPAPCKKVYGIGENSVKGCVHLRIFVDAIVSQRHDDEAQQAIAYVVPFDVTFFISSDIGLNYLVGLDTMAHYKIDVKTSTSEAEVETERGMAIFPVRFSRVNPEVKDKGVARWSSSMHKWEQVHQSVCRAEELETIIKVAEAKTVPPDCAVFVKTSRLPGAAEICWQVEPIFIEQTDIGARGATAKSLIVAGNLKRKGPGLFFHNYSPRPMTLPQGLPIAVASPLPPTCQVVEAGEPFVLTAGDASAGAPPPLDDSSHGLLDPNDQNEEQLASARAEVEKERPSTVVAGVKIACGNDGKPQTKLEEVIRRHEAAFSQDGKPGHVTGESIRIPTVNEHLLKPQPFRPLGALRREVERKEIAKLLEWGVIQPSRSRLSSCPVVVRQTNRWRYCIDFRHLNAHTIADAYPMQRTDTLFAALHGSKLFSSLDAARGYHQLEIHPDDRWKTAFSTHQGLFEFTMLPFGLRNAPAEFQRVMDQKVLGSSRWRNSLVYIDDIILYTIDDDQHVAVLDEVLGSAEKIGLKFSSAKSFIGYPSLKMLGRMVSDDGLSVLHDRTKAVREMQRPKTLSELYTLNGLFGYYRPFIVSYARRAEPLLRLTRGLVYKQLEKGGPYRLVRKGEHGDEVVDPKKLLIEWGKEQDDTVDDLKNAITTPPTMPYPDPTRPYLLYHDASYDGISAILHQLFEVDEEDAEPQSFTVSAILLSSALDEKVKGKYANDKVFAGIFNRIQEGQVVRPYEIKEDKLLVTLDDETRLCLPDEMLRDVALDFHESMGHLAKDKLLQALRHRFYHPSLAKVASEVASTCPQCQKSKPSRQAPAGEITDIRQIPPVAYGTVSMDLVTGLPPAGQGRFNAILVIKCLWTRATTLIATKDTLTAEGLAKLWFNNVTARGFAPSKIISDMGPQFIATFWKEWQARLGTKLTYCARGALCT